MLRPAQTLVYKKERTKKIHAVENFFNTLDLKKDYKPWISLEYEYHTDYSNQLIALIPTVSPGRPLKTWPLNKFIDLATMILAGTFYRIVIIGDNTSYQAGDMIRKINPERIDNLAGKLTLDEIKNVLASCAVAIGGDTGPLHIASAVGTQTIGLYGPSEVNRSRPYRENCVVLTSPLGCIGCEKKRCFITNKKQPPAPCMEEIYVPDVYNILLSSVD